ncbi:Protein BFR2 [Vanrija pseudolonga]|uniref:Protein BFR2 n=1 Tax=Vanrija pseudolonga TaxID=143232 RepID=A0AAF1BLL1_9TREE|nr:Protein BFR2 [Vanrija pseudolonga]
MSRPTLAQQLKQLGEEPTSIDPESAYASLDSHDLSRTGDEGREHYLDVGPSKLRAAAGAAATQTLLGDKYGGKTSSRMKIFDDEDDEEDDEEDVGGGFDDEDEEEGEEDEDEDEDDEELDEDEEEDEEDDDEEEDARPAPSGRTLDPVGALRESRLKDIEKGRAIKRQKDLFDNLVTLRITFQKALGATFKIPSKGEERDDDPAGEIEDKRAETLKSLGKLSETLFALREGITLPGVEAPRKRKRTEDGDAEDEEYWKASAADSLALVDATHPQLIPILNKWSTKIQAASLQLGAKHAGGSKFLQSTRGATGVVDAIDASLQQRRDAPKPLLESEEAGYRALLREVIESRQGSSAVDLSHHRREKKKKREAERGGSKGRKLRYTVHDKAVNFVVPIPLEGGWHEEQVDELFSSLFGGVGLAGAISTTAEEPANGGLTDLGGLKVF